MALNNAINQYSYLLGNGADGEGKPRTFTDSDATTGIETLVTQDDRNSVTRIVVANETTDTNSSAQVSVRNGSQADAQRASGGIGAWSKDYTVTTSRTGRVALYSNSDADGPAVLFSSSQDFIMSVPSGPTILYKMLGTGERTIPRQPCFLADISSTISNVTGDGTAYSVIFGNEIFDQNSDYNHTTGVFTAPVSGRYLISAGVLSRAYSGSESKIQGSIVTSNRSYNIWYTNYVGGSGGYLQVSGSKIVDMDASDTCYIDFIVDGGTKTIDINEGNASTSFSGALLF